MNIVDPKIEEYLEKNLTVGDPVLREMQRYAESVDFPIVGPQVGRLLNLLARSIGATRVLELGSGFGYSALWFAHAVGPAGRVVLTESSKTNAARAKEFLQKARMLERAQIEIGNGLEIIGRLPGVFDLIFSDVDKRDYPKTLELVRPHLRTGGLFVTDNMLWHGEVLTKNRTSDLRGVKEFTRDILTAPDFATTILPIRDGMAIALKIA